MFGEDKIESRTKKIIRAIKFDHNCSVCTRKINKNQLQKALPCASCLSLIHRKCSGFSPYELNTTDPSKLTYWECKKCHSEKFPNNSISDEELYAMSYNSNFSCPCQSDVENEVYRKQYVLNLTKFINKNDDPKNTDGPDPLNNIDKVFDMQIAFDYYTTHQFHKLSSKSTAKKSKPQLSIYHTNVSSLQGNFEKLHTHLASLNHPFEIIALSETWNPLHKKDSFKAPDIDGYKKYIGTPGTSMKSGCGLYIKNSLKAVERKELDVSFVD